jgi:6-phosphogluconate dehydrogenase
MATGGKCDFAILGLGRMGANLMRQAVERGYRVAGYTHGAPPESPGSRFRLLFELSELRDALKTPRKVFLYVPAGAAVDELIGSLADVLESGDIVLDGGNSYWGDSIRRARKLKTQGLHLLDLGTSGGVDGARNGACFMIGGPRAQVAQVEPILKKLATRGGYVHAGGSGAGHFTKLVHNGIEFGMLQAIGEGVDLLEHFPSDLPIADVLACWRHGSVIRSWLIDLMEERYRGDGMKSVPGVIEDTGEVNWLVADAMELEVATPAIALSVTQLIASRDTSKNWARAIAMMRHGFGGHPYGRSKHLQRERRGSRIGGFIAPEKGS